VKLEKSDFIPYGRQYISEEDIESVVKVLRSDFITQGSVVPNFEKKICNYTGSKYSVAVNSCTSALHIACLALNLGSGDVLWTSPITFVASANCALYCGASIDFVDIEPDTALVSVEKLKEKLELAKKEGRLPKIFIPVHFAGQPCDMKEIHNLSKQYGFKIIEDAAHAIGAKYQDKLVGGCQYSDITVFSFHPVKIMTTGEGGMAMTNNLKLVEKMKLLRSHGITRELNKMHKNPDGPWYYEQIELGFNYRMTDFQAALGISQLNRIDKSILKRADISKWYDKKFKDLGVSPLVKKIDRHSANHLYVIRINSGKQDRDKLYDSLRKSNVGVNLHYIPVYKHYHHCFSKKNFRNSERYYECAISLPIYPEIGNENLARIFSNIKCFKFTER
jgi:UDP-4-amino-4,6-dideoxy-N-acetyl-beta-L-altrosamine transaminase